MQDAEKAVDVPIWERAHNDLERLKEVLIASREERVRTGDRIAAEIAEIDAALSRIQPSPRQEMVAAKHPASTGLSPANRY